MSNPPDPWQYYVSGVFLAAISLVIFLIGDTTYFNVLLGISIFGIGVCLCFAGYCQELKKKGRELPDEEMTDSGYRVVNTQGGTYNESVQGDYVTIQGNQIYINQEPSQFTAQIQEILSQLQHQGLSRKIAEQQVTKELKKHSLSNAKLREKLICLGESLENPNKRIFNVTEAVERVVKNASESSQSSVYESILVVGGRYQRLYDFLRDGDWKRADEETVKIILDFMPHRGYRYFDINQIPPKDLKKINQLWVKYSNGRFGFSVQQSIWKKVLKLYNHSEYWVDDNAYLAFIDCVGWAREDDRIYHGDFRYSLKAPRGHLPAILMLDFSSYYSSNYHHLNTQVFNNLMKRNYYNAPFIPSWLKQWLTIE